MNNNNSKGISYKTGFFLLIGLAFLGLAVAALVGGAILVLVTGGNTASMKDLLNNPANAGVLRVIQTVSVLISMFLPAVLAALILNRKPFQLLGFRKEFPFKQIGLVALIVFASLFVAGGFGYLNKQIPVPADWKISFDKMESSYMEQVEIMLNLKSFGGYLLSLAIMAFLPAVCEEMLFRGGLQNFLTRATNKPWVAIIIVSILFSLVHFSFYGFLPRMFLGVVLGLIYYATQNLWLSILAHFLNNALAVTQAYILTRQGKGMKEVMNDDMPTLYWGFILIPVLFMLFKALKNTAKENALTAAHADGSRNLNHGI